MKNLQELSAWVKEIVDDVSKTEKQQSKRVRLPHKKKKRKKIRKLYLGNVVTALVVFGGREDI